MPVEAPRPARHLEVERKFDVIESTVSPSFEGIAAVVRVEQSPTQQLDAVYFDTPSHDLARNQITLRRRTGGADAGWHLKLPAGPDKRTEMRAPLSASGDAVPAELLDVVLAIVRDQPVQPSRGSALTAKARSCTAPGATRWRNSATTTSPHGRPGHSTPLVQRTTALPNSSGANGNWNWSPRMGPPIPSYWTG